MKITAVIMAGGRGERFWPKSRKSCPKQFLALTDDGQTMLQQAAQRLQTLVADEDIFIVANQDYQALIQTQLPQIPAANILCEPAAKNTAPCIGFAAAVLKQKYGNAVMLVLPADHLINDSKKFAETLRQAVAVAQQGENLVTIGIPPSYPETGYGYICCEPPQDKATAALAVKRFVEKPDRKTAEAYLVSGNYLWNSGMFVWKVSTILKQFEVHMPALHNGLQTISAAWNTPAFEKVLEECYQQFEAVSIDYGIMEHARPILTVPGSFGWDDAGSWLVLERINQPNQDGNVLHGQVAAVDCEKCIINGGTRMIAAIGLQDLVVVDTEDALLICSKSHTQSIKQILEQLKKTERQDLL